MVTGKNKKYRRIITELVHYHLLFLFPKSCWLIAPLKLVWYERTRRGLQLPHLDTCSFARMFQEAMQQFNSSTQLFDPRRLVSEFIRNYMPHEQIREVMSNNQETSNFFECLRGYVVAEDLQRRNVDRYVYPCLPFSDFQPPVEWRQNIPPCNCPGRQNSVNQEKLLSYINITLFEGEEQGSSLQQLVEHALNDEKPLRPNFFCEVCRRTLRGMEKTTLIRGIDALPIKIEQTQQSTRVRLGGDLAINTRDEGVQHYSLLGGVQYTPGHFGK